MLSGDALAAARMRRDECTHLISVRQCNGATLSTGHAIQFLFKADASRGAKGRACGKEISANCPETPKVQLFFVVNEETVIVKRFWKYE